MRRFLVNLRYAWNIKKPKLILRLAWNYIQAAVFGKVLLRYVDMSIGYRCNLKCAHCFAAQDRDKPNFNEQKRMPPRFFAEEVVPRAMKMGAVNFSFQGGEPLMYDDLKDYIKAAQPDKNLISITTNGTLLTQKKMQQLRSWGVDILTISVDKFHSRLDLLNLLVDARKAGLRVTLSTVVTHEQMSDPKQIEALGDLAGFCYDQQAILLLILAVAMGRWAGNPEVMLDETDMVLVRRIEREIPYVRTDFKANYARYGCGAAKEILFIKPEGDVYCCPFIDISFGNLKCTDITTIRNRMLENKTLSEYSKTCLAGEGGGIWKRSLRQG